MDTQGILAKVDHTLLGQTSTWEEIQSLCDDAMKYQTASVCIPPSFVKQAKDYVGQKLTICTVIGFPNGYQTTEVKLFETENAIENGATEIDMVANLGWIRQGDWEKIKDEIFRIKKVCKNNLLKVIIETCLLTEEEKINMCTCVTEAGADYIKTSTGFSVSGATREDVELFSNHVGAQVKIKAAGGIKSLQDAEEFIQLGASRLGTSSIVKMVNGQETKGY